MYLDLRNRKKADDDLFSNRHEPFAAKLAQMNLKDNNKYMYSSKQITKHLWDSCPKSELKHLHNMESNLTKILQDKDKYKKFQVLLRKIEKQLKNEKNQSKIRNDSQDDQQVFSWLNSNTT